MASCVQNKDLLNQLEKNDKLYDEKLEVKENLISSLIDETEKLKVELQNEKADKKKVSVDFEKVRKSYSDIISLKNGELTLKNDQISDLLI